MKKVILALLVTMLVQNFALAAGQVRVPASGSSKIEKITAYTDYETQACLQGRVLIRVDGTWYFVEGKTEDGKSLMSLALTAKTTNTEVVLYVQDSGGACTGAGDYKAVHSINLQ